MMSRTTPQPARAMGKLVDGTPVAALARLSVAREAIAAGAELSVATEALAAEARLSAATGAIAAVKRSPETGLSKHTECKNVMSQQRLQILRA